MKPLLISVQKNLNILNLKLLHSVLRKNGYDSTLLYLTRFDINNSKMLSALEGFVRDFQPGWVGISLTASEFQSAKGLTLFLKKRFDTFPIIWGGIYPTSVPKKCAEIADYVCIGEGEQAVLDISKAIQNSRSLKYINNLGWLENGEFIQNPLNPLLEDLDSLPFTPRLAPNAYILAKDKVQPLTRELYMKHSAFYGGIYRIVGSRGCPYQCTYCVNSIFPKLYSCWKTRWPSPERMVEEIRAGVNENLPLVFVSIMDDNLFALKEDYLEKFFGLYKERVNKPFIAFSSPNFITEKKLELAVESGLSALHIGLQTGSTRVSREIYHRVSDPKSYVRIAQLVHKYPIVPYYDIICDNPFETEEDEIETIKMIMNLPKPYFFLLFSLTFYEGTKLREKVAELMPEQLHDDTQKDTLIIKETPVNLLKHFATIFPKFYVEYLLKRYRDKPNHFYTKFLFSISKYVGIFVIQPFIYLWILFRFNKYSFIKSIKSLSLFFDFRAVHIFGHFHTQRDTTWE